jgi:hypothetical protein
MKISLLFSAIRFLYAVEIMEIVQFIARSWKYFHLQNYTETVNLSLVVSCFGTLLLLGLCIVDGTTIYLEVSFPNRIAQKTQDRKS